MTPSVIVLFTLVAAPYNGKTSLMLCCPVTNQAKGYPFEVPVAPAGGAQITGVVLADQVRCLDWKRRNATKFAAVTAQCALGVSLKSRR